MKVSLNWLKEFVDIPISAQELADKLSLAGHEVESVTHYSQTVSGIVTGRIEAINKHPDADKLQITMINDGTIVHQIVTGAQNIAESAIVPVSLPGAVLANGTAIKASQLRGIDSNGMLCSQVELGLAEESTGIWLLPPDTPLGVDLAEFAQIKDAVLDISVLPNRGDCQSIIGIAREIAVILGTDLRLPTLTDATTLAGPSILTIQNTAPDTCTQYHARTLTLRAVPTTPLWMQLRLTRCGINTISPIVDVTNYVMLEFGQPLHAFDQAKVATNTLIIRHPKAGESIQTLDEKTVTLQPTDLLIADEEKGLALAGIMGGFDSGVNNLTSQIILESAQFNPVAVRKSKQRHHLTTQSAIRFEKGIDPNQTKNAIHRATAIMASWSNASIIGAIASYTSPTPEPEKIDYNPAKINQLLGTNWDPNAMTKILKSLGFTIDSAPISMATPPAWRHDITEWPCLAEEIARIHGLDNIPTTPITRAIPTQAPSPISQLDNQLTSLLTTLGFQQLNTLPMINATQDAVVAPQLIIQNPINPDQAVMRSSLKPSLLSVLRLNLNKFNGGLNAFEIAKVFHTENDTIIETTQLGILVTLPQNPAPYTQADKALNTVEFADLKGVSELLLEHLNTAQFQWLPSANPHFHPKQQAALKRYNAHIGTIGFLHPTYIKPYDITLPVGYIELNLSIIATQPQPKPKAKPLAKFPSTTRDIALLAPRNLEYGAIHAAILTHKSKLVKEIQLVDLYINKSLGDDKKSLCFSLIYQDPDRTLTDTEVNTAHTQLSEQLCQHLPITLR